MVVRKQIRQVKIKPVRVKPVIIKLIKPVRTHVRLAKPITIKLKTC